MDFQYILSWTFEGFKCDKNRSVKMGNVLKTIHGRIIVVEDIPTPPMRELTMNQVNIIKTTWEIPAAKPLDTGEKILYTFLEKYPHNQLRFQAFKNTPIIMLKGA